MIPSPNPQPWPGPCTAQVDSDLISSILVSLVGSCDIITNDITHDYSNQDVSATLTLSQARDGSSVPQYPFYAKKQKCCNPDIQISANAGNTQAGIYNFTNGNDFFTDHTQYYYQIFVRIITTGSSVNNNLCYIISIDTPYGALISGSDPFQGFFDNWPVSPSTASWNTINFVSDPIPAASIIGTRTWSISGSGPWGGYPGGSIVQSLVLTVTIS